MRRDIPAAATARVVPALMPNTIPQTGPDGPIAGAFKLLEIGEAKAQHSAKIRCVDLGTHVTFGQTERAARCRPPRRH